MATATLPGNLHIKINALARRMAMLRVARVVAGFVVLLAVTAGLALLADHFWKLPIGLRFVLFGGWLVLAGLGAIRSIRSLNTKSDADALAALIESEYPNLAERLTTSVELSEAPDGGHGSPALIDLLLRETEIRASSLDFLQAAPERPNVLPIAHRRRYFVLAGCAGIHLAAFVQE